MKSLEDWLDIRSGEMRKVVLCAVGAFLLLSFVVLFQSIRKSLFLTYFDAKNLPYVTAGIACLSLPAVGLFAGLIERFHPWMVLQRILILLCAGLGLLWAFSEFIRVVTVLFYLWVTIGALLLTSGFWVLTAESFAVRGAKRLFGLITAGGTAGAMVTGLSLDWIAPDFESIHLMPILVAILILLYLVEYWMYRFLNVSDEEKLKDGGSRDNDSERGRFAGVPFLSNLSNNIGMIRKSPYLGSIAALVFVATVASSIVDYQFNEFAQIHIGRGDKLAGFFGAFYGWTGCIALILQLALTSRVIRSAGVTFGLAVLPVFLLFGSTGFLVFPGLIVATLVRGGDNIFRKSLLRPVVEFLYVPIPAKVRRKTKTFIDSFVDSAGEGTGAAVVYVWVVIAGQHSRYLSVLVALLSLALFFLSWRMGKRYMDTIVSQLKSDDLKADQPDLPAGSHQPGFNVDLLAASFSRMDLQSMFIDMKTIGQTGSGTPVFRNEELSREHQKKSPRYQPAAPRDLASLLKSSDDTLIQKTLEDTNDWGEEWTPFLTRLLARDSIHKTVARTLAG
ncbi:MAG: Npt1/Npt2 family nucleotide transporter, partial [Acidobacteriota bacterium]